MFKSRTNLHTKRLSNLHFPRDVSPLRNPGVDLLPTPTLLPRAHPPVISENLEYLRLFGVDALFPSFKTWKREGKIFKTSIFHRRDACPRYSSTCDRDVINVGPSLKSWCRDQDTVRQRKVGKVHPV
ncbi:hypothetical protein NPIL_372191 [Nephila pilipes]|uniref:Uncharacterized protein n=1 Tax=Nephila pilipes TaxID=299642 RepID=A0A8X6IWC2_NEPPI|nr:hypothetical protein NPIL_594671 [Nephila pilipes]GFT35873.1 hypothetical protein NPIL_372191 [Nephila pilipes]